MKNRSVTRQKNLHAAQDFFVYASFLRTQATGSKEKVNDLKNPHLSFRRRTFKEVHNGEKKTAERCYGISNTLHGKHAMRGGSQNDKERRMARKLCVFNHVEGNAGKRQGQNRQQEFTGNSLYAITIIMNRRVADVESLAVSQR